jgi:hypothetical protein
MARATLLMLFLWTATAAAQECVSCRSARCDGMFWIEPCKAKKAKPPKPVEKPPAGAYKPADRRGQVHLGLLASSSLRR